MSCVFELNPQCISNEYVLAVVIRLKPRQRWLRFLDCLQRQCGEVLGKSLLVGPTGVFFLQVAAVAQHDVAKIIGGMGAVDLALETLFAQTGQIA